MGHLSNPYKLVIFFIIVLFFLFWNIRGKRLGTEKCKIEIAKEVHGKVLKIGHDPFIANFYMIFLDGTRYIPFNFNFSYDIKAGDSIYKVPGEFTFYIYKNCNPTDVKVIKDTLGCKDCKGFLW